MNKSSVSVSLSVSSSISVCLCLCLPACLPVCLSVCLCLCLCLSVSLSLSLSLSIVHSPPYHLFLTLLPVSQQLSLFASLSVRSALITCRVWELLLNHSPFSTSKTSRSTIFTTRHSQVKCCFFRFVCLLLSFLLTISGNRSIATPAVEGLREMNGNHYHWRQLPQV